jgi:ABC-type uncharacterized transport system auxiliary subunit
MTTNVGVASLLGGACVFMACSMPRVHYYTLEVPHSSPGHSAESAFHITVQRFQADRVLRDDRILYRERPNELGFYEYNRWVGPPADLVTGYFTHRLKDSGVYARISSQKEGPRPDFILEGRIHRFEEVDRGKEVFASVALELELTDANSRKQVWRGEEECTRPLSSKDVSALVTEIHGCLDETATKLLDRMQKQIGGPRN